MTRQPDPHDDDLDTWTDERTRKSFTVSQTRGDVDEARLRWDRYGAALMDVRRGAAGEGRDVR